VTIALVTVEATEEGIVRIMFMGRPSKLGAISRGTREAGDSIKPGA